jgi:hypothetical protein
MPEPPTVFDLTEVGPPKVLPASEGDSEQIEGAPGAVPGRATVRVTNLDQAFVATAVDARADGSFTIPLLVVDGEELRFEWLQGQQRSEPADALFMKPDPAEPAFELQPSPRFSCLLLAPGYVLEFAVDGPVTLTLENGCDDAITIDNARSRIGLADFTPPAALPVSVAAGESDELVVDFARAVAGFREDTLLIDVTLGAETIRYPITLRAE